MCICLKLCYLTFLSVWLLFSCPPAHESHTLCFIYRCASMPRSSFSSAFLSLSLSLTHSLSFLSAPFIKNQIYADATTTSGKSFCVVTASCPSSPRVSTTAVAPSLMNSSAVVELDDVGVMMHGIPAATAALRPTIESSITTHRSRGTPSRSLAML